MRRPRVDPELQASAPVRGRGEPAFPVWPPSRALAQAIHARLDLSAGELLLEYAPSLGGTLAETALWLRKRGTVRYLGIEPDPARARVLRLRHPDLTIHVGLCQDMFRILDHHDLPEPRAVLLQPGVCFDPEPELERLLELTARVLGRRGRLIAIATEDGRHGPSLVQLDALLQPWFHYRSVVASVPGAPAADLLLARA